MPSLAVLRQTVLKFTPRKLGAALAAWYAPESPKWQDSARTTPATADTNPVGAWDDLSGNGRHLLQATPGARPLLKTAIQNGRSVVRFDGVDDVLQKLTLSIATPLTVVFVCRELAGGTSKYFFDGGASNQSPVFIADATHISMGGTPILTSAACTPTNWQLYTCQFNGASSAIAINGGADTAGNALTNTLTGITLGASGGAGAWVNADFGEVIICQGSVVPPGMLARLKNYLNKRWAIY